MVSDAVVAYHRSALFSCSGVVDPSAANTSSICGDFERVGISWLRIWRTSPLQIDGSRAKLSPHLGKPQSGMAYVLIRTAVSEMNLCSSPIREVGESGIVSFKEGMAL